MQEVKVESVDGYTLFNDIEDIELRSYNRAMIMANIIEDNLAEKDGRVNQKGMYHSTRYFEAVPVSERQKVYGLLQEEVIKRKLIPGGI